MKERTGIILDRNLLKNERPYFIIPDNVKSNMRIDHIGRFESIERILKETSLAKANSDLSFYRTEFLTKQMITYQNNK